MDEIEVGGDHLFDQIDDLLEFPTDVGGSEVFGSVAGDCAGFHTVWPEEDLPQYSGCCSRSTASDFSTELFVPYEDIVQLDWLSTFVEDSFSGGGGGGGSTPEKTQITCSENNTIDAFQNRFQTSSPVSVLESSSNTLSEGTTVPVSHEKRARSKRPRPATFSPRSAIPLIAPGQPAPVTSNNPIKKIKILPPSGSNALHLTTDQIQEQEQDQNLNAATVRKCKHCGITKTPQWRSGPMGPKSLCNACGVRYKSGRLYPEYRPAASPTFVPSLHSNSHKKVLEMRGCN